MDRCAAAGISDLPSILPMPAHPKQIQHLYNCNSPFPFVRSRIRSSSGLRYYVNSSLRSATDKHEPDGVIIVEDNPLDERKDHFDMQPNEEQSEGLFSNISLQLFKFLGDFDIKLDYAEYYSVVVFSGGGLVALWLAAALLDAIDSIPLFPKIMELVGFGFSLWFSSRFLIFKENRDELVDRFEQVKKEVVGTEDD